jgi:uncharacterized damage-inducible protein DinB
MFSSMADFLRYFAAVNRRAVRDIGALPPEAEGWRPSVGEGEQGWDINTIVGHMAGSRLYFASAYVGRGWISPSPPDVSTRARWAPALETSAAALQSELEATPEEWIQRKIAMIDTNRSLSGWRVLMMMMEHDIHHRSQIDTYAGINGWDPPDIYGRSAEQVEARQDDQLRKYRE